MEDDGLDRTDEVFLTRGGSPLSGSGATKILQKFGWKSGGISPLKVNSRNLRRSEAAIGGEKKMDRSKLSRKMDHSEDTHIKYYEFSAQGRTASLALNEQLRDAVSKK